MEEEFFNFNLGDFIDKTILKCLEEFDKKNKTLADTRTDPEVVIASHSAACSTVPQPSTSHELSDGQPAHSEGQEPLPAGMLASRTLTKSTSLVSTCVRDSARDSHLSLSCIDTAHEKGGQSPGYSAVGSRSACSQCGGTLGSSSSGRLTGSGQNGGHYKDPKLHDTQSIPDATVLKGVDLPVPGCSGVYSVQASSVVDKQMDLHECVISHKLESSELDQTFQPKQHNQSEHKVGIC